MFMAPVHAGMKRNSPCASNIEEQVRLGCERVVYIVFRRYVFCPQEICSFIYEACVSSWLSFDIPITPLSGIHDLGDEDIDI